MLAHLARHGRRYDVVHTASFPYFSLLAAGALRRRGRYDLVVDWHEVWSRDYWRSYLGPVGGAVGHLVQRLCIRLPQRAFCFSRLHRDRLVASGLRGEVDVLEGEYAGDLTPPEPRPAEPLVVFAGRHIPEKRTPAVVPALARARQRLPSLRAEIYGDGPDREKVLAAIAAEGLHGVVAAPGFVDAGQVESALRRALCMVLPSEREGYGLVVVEASARGTPSVVVRGPDNAAVELVDDGQNGVVAESASPEHLAAAILRVHEAEWSCARAPAPGSRATPAGCRCRRRSSAWCAPTEASLSPGVGYLERNFAATEDENRAAIRAALLPRPGGVLVDLGCGDGVFTADVGRCVGAARVVGVEFVDAIAERAREAGVQVVVADLGGRLPIDDASVDAVHSNQVIEHLPRTDHFLAEVRRILKPDGYAVISTNNLASWHNIVSLTMGWQPFPSHVSDDVYVGNPLNFAPGPTGLGAVPGQTHLRVFTGRALAELGRHHGLEPEVQKAAGYYPLPPRAARLAARWDPRHGAFLVHRFRPAPA